MNKRLLGLLALFVFLAVSLEASTTAVIKVRCYIPAIPPIDMSELKEGTLDQEDNPNFIVQTEEKEEEELRIIFRTVVAK
jgi:hypothetical protein